MARPSRVATRWLPIAAAVVVVLALAAGAYFLTGRGSQSNQLLGEMFPNEGQQHVAEGSPIQYKSVPPTSGPHYPAPKDWGVFDQAVVPGYWVHNLEHGGVVLLYNCPSGCPDVVSVGQDAFKTFPKDKYGEVKLVVTPYSGLPDGVEVAAVAWQYAKLYHGDFNRENFLAFYNGHIDRSPEDVP
jgi:hypothetical protein